MYKLILFKTPSFYNPLAWIFPGDSAVKQLAHLHKLHFGKPWVIYIMKLVPLLTLVRPSRKYGTVVYCLNSHEQVSVEIIELIFKFSFWSDRYWRFSIPGYSSDLLNISAGIPQSSTFGHFFVYVNVIVDNIKYCIKLSTHYLQRTLDSIFIVVSNASDISASYWCRYMYGWMLTF